MMGLLALVGGRRAQSPRPTQPSSTLASSSSTWFPSSDKFFWARRLAERASGSLALVLGRPNIVRKGVCDCLDKLAVGFCKQINICHFGSRSR